MSFRTLFENANFGILYQDRNGRIVEANPAAERILGLDSQSLVGRSSEDPRWRAVREDGSPFPGDVHPAMVALKTGEHASAVMGIWNPVSDSRVWILVNALPEFRAGGTTASHVIAIFEDITERKRTEGALRENARELREVQRIAGLGSFRLGLATMTWTSSDVLDEIFGIVNPAFRRDVSGWLSIVHPAEREEMAAYFSGEVLGKRRAFDRDYRIVRLDDRQERWVHGAGILVSDRENRLVELVGTIQDITERKRTDDIREATYRISEAATRAENLHELFEQVREILGALLPTRNFYVALVDRENGMLSFPYFVDEADPSPDPKPLGRGLTEYVIRTGEPLLASKKIQDELGAQGEIELIGAPSIDWLGAPLKESGETIGAVVVQTYSEGVRFTASDKDVLAFTSDQFAQAIVRMRAKEALRSAVEALKASEARYRVLFDHTEDGIVLTDPENGRFLYFNPSICAMFGYTSIEFGRLTPAQLHPQGSLDALQDALARVAAGKRAHSDVIPCVRKDGTTFLADIHRSPVELEERRVVFTFLRDITERVQLEQQLRQSQKMEAIGRLAGGVAHDFNNILTAILGYSDLVLMGDAPADVRQNVEEVRKGAERAAALTRQLLAFSRKQVLQPLILEMNDVVKSLDPMLRRVLRENVRIVHEPDPHLWRVKADPGQIEQILINLGVNASDAMPEGGTLTIGTRNVTLDSGEVGGIPILPGAYVLLEVSDTGHGMDAETLAHAFEPFFTTKERGKGTGLGLATVYGIVKQSGGYVQALSERAKGATFRIYLPRVHGAADSPSNVSPRPTNVRASETILLVEDEEAVRGLVRAVLRARGYQVLVAESAEVALGLARAHPERIHLLLTDVVLPGMDGHRLAEVLRAERPEIAVLLCSGYFDAGEGVDKNEHLLRKPFTPGALVETVRSTLRRARPRSN